MNASNVQESKHLKIISSVDFALRIDWPLQLWNAVTEQTLIALNLLRTSRIDRTKSAYHQKSWVTNMIGMHIRYKERKKYHSVWESRTTYIMEYKRRTNPKLYLSFTFLLREVIERQDHSISSTTLPFTTVYTWPTCRRSVQWTIWSSTKYVKSQPRRSCSENVRKHLIF